MLEVHAFGSLAVVIRHWYEIGPMAREHGARIELRRRERGPRVGTESAAQPFVLGDPLWRADLFDLVGGRVGGFEKAHVHVRFEGIEPVPRGYLPSSGADAMEWAREQLSDPAALMVAAGADTAGLEGDLRDIADAASDLVARAERLTGARCTSVEQCKRWTSDIADTVSLMETMYGNGVPAYTLA